MKKKLSLILCLMFMVLGLAACGQNPADIDYFGMSYEQMQSTMENEVAALVSLNEESIAYLQSTGNEITIRMVETWVETTSELEGYQGLGAFTVTKTQDTVTVEQIVKYSGRDIVVSYVYKYNYDTKMLELSSAITDKVYTMGEKLQKAALNTLMGMGTVFTVLILISLIIYCFRFISYFQNRTKGKTEVKEEKVAVPEPIRQQEDVQLTDDLELVAVISAAIAASAGTSTDSFVVRSINRR